MDQYWLEQMVNSFGSLELFQAGAQQGLGHTRDEALGCQKPCQSLVKSLTAGVWMESFVPSFYASHQLKDFLFIFCFQEFDSDIPNMFLVVCFVFKLLGIH